MGTPAKVMAAQEGERRFPPLAAVEVGYLVGMRRPLSSLSAEKQKQIRQAYADTDWAVSDTDTDVTFLGFCTDHEAAVAKAAEIPGGFWVRLPVNGFLSLRVGRETIQGHPNSEASCWYEASSPGVGEHLDNLEQRLAKVCELASSSS